jgi:hypothetical protein
MGVLDLFSKDGREQRAREKNIKTATNKFRQSPDRMKALQDLRDDGSPDALYGMLRRFGMMYDKSIEDEQEKEWVFDTLAAKGGVVLGPLKKYLHAADSISWPLRLLEKIVATKDEQIDVIEEVLARHEPGYERDPTKKIQLLNHLGGFKHARVPPLAAPYLGDMDEGVRYASAETLLRENDEAAARLPLLDHFVSPQEDSLRIRILIADGLAERGWTVGDRRAEVEKLLPEAFAIEGSAKEPASARIKKKPAAKE